jgi:hypothetical protein
VSHCIPVTLSDGSVVSANVDDGVTELEPEDIQALEEWVAFVKARRAKKRLSQRLTRTKSQAEGSQSANREEIG